MTHTAADPQLCSYGGVLPTPESAELTPPSAPVFQLLDAFRGMACIWVVFYHVATQLALRSPQTLQAAWYPVASLGFLGVQIFFVVSGYCIASAANKVVGKQGAFSNFARARIRRIMPPYLASVLLILMLKVGMILAVSAGFFKTTGHLTVDPRREGILFYVSNFTLTQILFKQQFVSRVAWTLCYEAAFYSIVAVMLLLVRRSVSLLMLIHGITILCVAALLINPARVPFPFDLWGQFGLGVVVFDFLRLKPRRDIIERVLPALVIALTLSVVLFRDAELSPVSKSSRLTYACAASFALLLLLLHGADRTIRSHPTVRPIGFLGKMSYSLYLVHFAIITSVMTMLPHGGHGMLKLIELTAFPIPFAAVFFLFFERPFIGQRRHRGLMVAASSPALALI